MAVQGGIVNRNFMVPWDRGVGCSRSGVCAGSACEAPAKKSAGGGVTAATGRGAAKRYSTRNAAFVTTPTATQKKIGPRSEGNRQAPGTFTVNNKQVTDEALKTWIENGDKPHAAV